MAHDLMYVSVMVMYNDVQWTIHWNPVFIGTQWTQYNELIYYELIYYELDTTSLYIIVHDSANQHVCVCVCVCVCVHVSVFPIK